MPNSSQCEIGTAHIRERGGEDGEEGRGGTRWVEESVKGMAGSVGQV